MIGMMITNIDCPKEFGQGQMLTKVKLEDNTMLYYVEVDEETADINMDSVATETSRQAFKTNINWALIKGDEATKEFVETCNEAKIGFGIKFISKQTGKTAINALSYNEIASLNSPINSIFGK